MANTTGADAPDRANLFDINELRGALDLLIKARSVREKAELVAATVLRSEIRRTRRLLSQARTLRENIDCIIAISQERSY